MNSKLSKGWKQFALGLQEATSRNESYSSDDLSKAEEFIKTMNYEEAKTFEVNIMRDPILDLSVEELAERQSIIDKEKKEKREKLEEQKRILADIKRRMSHLSENDAQKEYYKLLDDYPKFDQSHKGLHWTANLVRILNMIGFTPVYKDLANIEAVDDLHGLSNINIVKSHLNVATFDLIAVQMSDYQKQNDVNFEKVQDEKEETEQEDVKEIDEEDLSNENWGMY